MAKIITIANRKGGVGKTTTTLSLGAILQEKGFKVLYVDLDKQCDTTQTLQADINAKGVYEILSNGEIAKNVIQVLDTENKKYYVLSANKNLSEANDKLNQVIGREYRLRDSLKSVSEYFDFIILDTPPNIDNITINALTCSDYLVVTSMASKFSFKGTNDLFTTAKAIKDYTNPNLIIGGVLITRYNTRTILSKDIKEALNKVASDNNTKVYNQFIRVCNALEEAQTKAKDIVDYAKGSNAYNDYLAFTNEVLKDLKESEVKNA